MFEFISVLSMNQSIIIYKLLLYKLYLLVLGCLGLAVLEVVASMFVELAEMAVAAVRRKESSSELRE